MSKLTIEEWTRLLPESLRWRVGFTAPEVAKLLGLSASAVHGLLARGALRSIVLGGGRGDRKHRLVPITALFEFLEVK